MHKRIAAPVAGFATAILLLGACSDEGDSSTPSSESPTTTAVGELLAEGDEVQLVGEVTSGLRNQTLDIVAHQRSGEATGDIRFDDNVIRVECADTAVD